MWGIHSGPVKAVGATINYRDIQKKLAQSPRYPKHADFLQNDITDSDVNQTSPEAEGSLNSFYFNDTLG